MPSNDASMSDAAGSNDAAAVSADGTYRTIAMQVSNIADTCSMPAPTAEAYAGFTVVIATMAGATTVTINTPSGAALLTGTLNGSTAMLMASGQVVEGACQFMNDTRATVTLNPGATVTVNVMQSRANFTSVAGMTCMPPAAMACSTSWTATFTRS